MWSIQLQNKNTFTVDLRKNKVNSLQNCTEKTTTNMCKQCSCSFLLKRPHVHLWSLRPLLLWRAESQIVDCLLWLKLWNTVWLPLTHVSNIHHRLTETESHNNVFVPVFQQLISLHYNQLGSCEVTKQPYRQHSNRTASITVKAPRVEHEC